jgi:hypothetical protein
MSMSIFEIIMLLCFGAAWPVSIRKLWVTKSSGGKSKLFLSVIIIGYIAGILHKIYYNMDGVIYLYLLNIMMVSIDLILVIKNQKSEEK